MTGHPSGHDGGAAGYIPPPADDVTDVPFTTGLFVEALSRGEPPSEDDELGFLLAAWRDDLTDGVARSAPPALRPVAPDLPDTGALASVHALKRPPRRPGRLVRALTTGAAAVAVLLAGVGVGSWKSHPGGPLWPVARVLYPEHAQAVAVEQTINRARRAISAHQYALAGELINLARHQLADADLPNSVEDRLRADIDDLVLWLIDALLVRPVDVAPPPLPTTPPPAAGQPNAPPTPLTPRTPGVTPTIKPAPRPGGLLPGLPLPRPSSVPSSAPVPDLPPSTNPTPEQDPAEEPEQMPAPPPVPADGGVIGDGEIIDTDILGLTSAADRRQPPPRGRPSNHPELAGRV